jgi:hypothetical protein
VDLSLWHQCRGNLNNLVKIQSDLGLHLADGRQETIAITTAVVNAKIKIRFGIILMPPHSKRYLTR